MRLREIRAVHVYGETPARTFDTAAARFVEESGHSKSFDRYEDSLKAVMPYIGHLPLSAIHAASLQIFIDQRQKQGRAAATINRDLAAVKRVLALAASLWRDANGKPWLASLPQLPTVQGDRRPPRPISQAEQAGLFQALPDYLAEMALFAVHTGLRAQELCGLQWDWEYTVTGLHASVFVIPAASAKNNRERIVPLNSIARSIIETRRANNTQSVFVFEVSGHRLSRPTNKAWNKAKAAAELKAVRWHDLRHTFGMRLRAQGVDEEDRADLLGHHRGSITTHYSKAEIAHLIDCVEKLCDTEDKPEMTLIKRKLK